MKTQFPFPIIINDVTISEVEYDYKALKGPAYIELHKKHKLPHDLAPTDPAAMLILGAGVIVASNPGKGWTTEDFINGAAGSTIWKLQEVGYGFFGSRPEEPAQQTSGDAGASMQNDSIPPSQT